MLDIEGKVVRDNIEILVENGVIREVVKEGSLDIRDAEVYSFEEGYCLPGLIDAHIHLIGVRTDNILGEVLMVPQGLRIIRAARDAEKLLMAGFTTVRDCGSIEALHVRDAIRQGEIIGPRIVASGYFLTQTFGHGDLFHSLPESWVDGRVNPSSFTLICNGPSEVRKAARYSFRSGGEFVKISTSGGVLSEKDKPEYTQFSEEEVLAAVEEALHVGSFVASHAQGTPGINLALKCGVKTIEHAIYPDEESFKTARKKDAIFIITYTIMRTIAEKGAESGYPPWAVEKAKRVREEYSENIKKCVREGVKLGLGTDFFGSSLTKMGTNARELVNLVKDLNIDPWKVLEMATITNAEACGLKGKIGLIKPGYLADIIVVRGNPIEDISLLAEPNNIVFVMKEGKVYKHLTHKS